MKQVRSYSSLNLFRLSGLFILMLSVYVVNAQSCPEFDCDTFPKFKNRVSITNAGYWKVINSNGIPNHKIGRFNLTDPLCGRPSELKEQDYTFIVPAFSAPGVLWPGTIFEIPKPPFNDLPETTFGVAVNGVPFDPIAGEWWNTATNQRQQTPTTPAWTINPVCNELMKSEFDCNYAHIQPEGSYHYHGFPTMLFDTLYYLQANAVLDNDDPDVLIQNRSSIVLLGWAFDGNPIYGEDCGLDNAGIKHVKSSYKFRSSTTVPAGRTITSNPSTTTFPMGSFVEDFWYDESLFNSDRTKYLDQCNGHTAVTADFKNGVYHYHILKKDCNIAGSFPYIGRCYRLFTYGNAPNIFPKPK